MNKGNRVKILTGFYQGMEGYIEDFKDGQYLVALKNDNGYVNTMMYPKRLELIEEETLLSKIHGRVLGLICGLNTQRASGDYIDTGRVLGILHEIDKDIRNLLNRDIKDA